MATSNRLQLLVIDYQRVNISFKSFGEKPLAITYASSIWKLLFKTLKTNFIIYLGFLGVLIWIKLEKRVSLASSKHHDIFASKTLSHLDFIFSFKLLFIFLVIFFFSLLPLIFTLINHFLFYFFFLQIEYLKQVQTKFFVNLILSILIFIICDKIDTLINLLTIFN